MKSKRRRVSPSTPVPPPPTTIDSLPDDVVADILLRLPSLAAILRAVLASKHWCRFAFTPSFVRRVRAAHPPAPLLGHFLSRANYALPLFQPAPVSLLSDPILAAVVRRGDFFLTRLREPGPCALEDCRAGLLLFSGRRSLAVFDPVAHRAVHVPRPLRHHGYIAHTFCLAPEPDGGGRAATGGARRPFRLVALQYRRRFVRAVVYDSGVGQWLVHSSSMAVRPARSHDNRYFPAMHAAGRVYWKYNATPLLLSLDTRTMHFSYVAPPPGVSHLSPFAVGETEDGACCLVRVRYGSNGFHHLQTWLRGGDGADQPWVLQREVPLMLRASAAARGKVRQVRSVVAGLVLVCFNGTSAYLPHVAFRLNSLKVEAEFTCRGPARPYLFD